MSDGSIDNAPEAALAPPAPERSAIFFDGESSRRRPVTVTFAYALELRESLNSTVRWQYDDVRRADSPAGILRLSCLSAPALARLEIRDPALAAEVIARCPRLDENRPGRGGAATIVGWSLAAAASIIAMVCRGVLFEWISNPSTSAFVNPASSSANAMASAAKSVAVRP